jgi:filamentous hemagglutinin family protein
MYSRYTSSFFHFWSVKVLLALVTYQPLALALPQGGVVTQGAALIQQESPTKLNIHQSSDRAIINWHSFSIGAPEWVNFQQPSSTSATLNRVTGNTPSSIAGKLTANGQIFLIIAKHTKVGMIWVAGRSPTLVSQNLKATTLTYLAIVTSF